MEEKDIQEFKDRLEKERAILEDELKQLGAQDPKTGDWVPNKPKGETFGADRNDNADIVEEMQENNASLNELEGRLNVVISALERIENGTYGKCEVSGEDIEVERLRANPAATTCMEHMDKTS